MGERSGNGPRAGAPVIAIFGPTAVGKTAVAIALAGLLRDSGEDPVAISADALQVYAGLETLTGAPTAEERARLEHRLLGFVPVTSSYSVGEFMPRAHAAIDSALAGGRRPIVVGGTGLYLRAALCELELGPPPEPGVRERLEDAAAARGVPALHADLAEAAPEVAATIDPSDRSRVIRALELLGARRHERRPGAESQLWTEETRRPTLLAGLVIDRVSLYELIDARVDAIARAGALEEVRRAEAMGASRTARAALGYRELLEGDLEAMKRRTRNYAKRQLTWVRKLAGVHTIDVTGRAPADVAVEIATLADRVAARS